MDMSLNKLREMVKDREAWCSVVPGVTKSHTRLNNNKKKFLSARARRNQSFYNLDISGRDDQEIQTPSMKRLTSLTIFEWFFVVVVFVFVFVLVWQSTPEVMSEQQNTTKIKQYTGRKA